jgi:CRISPR-associated endonuclease/helicase Cas3
MDSMRLRSEQTFDTESYKAFFKKLTKHEPFDYQLHLAEKLFQGRNIILRAPTGAGKTWAVLAPFLSGEWPARPARLIYALPLRTLAQGVYREACEAARKLGHPIESVIDARGRETVSPFVTLQTGEQPDDRFFDRGKIIVTTYDQLLSGLLDSPYGLSERLHNINAAAITGALVVFDEFHLMEPNRAFLTATACLHLFRDLCQSVWMTATATNLLGEILQEGLNTVSVPANDEETHRLMDSLPSIVTVTRRLAYERVPLSAKNVFSAHKTRSIVLLNTVRRAQKMFEQLQSTKGPETTLILLHSRFFKEDRKEKEEMLSALFGKTATGNAILVATQVVEAGLDLSCEHLHTELCPMNALVQRAGRCARFDGQTGTVHVYVLPEEDKAWLPYGDQRQEDICLTQTRLLLEQVGTALIVPGVAREWVEKVHSAADEQALREGWRTRLNDCLDLITKNAIVREPRRVADFIRGENNDSLRIILAEHSTLPKSPGQREGLSLSRTSLYRLLKNLHEHLGWYWNGSEEMSWKPLAISEQLSLTYIVCLSPKVAAYNSDVGLQLGLPGTHESPLRREPPRPGHKPLRKESWATHARLVANKAKERLLNDGVYDGLLGVGFQRRYGLTAINLLEAAEASGFLHDLGKLQGNWQRWAEAAQKSRNPTYVHLEALAHTDFDAEKAEDRTRMKSIELEFRRPHHAPASSYYSGGILDLLLPSISPDRRTYVASACAAAILSHHGGWLPEDSSMGISHLCPNWERDLKAALGLNLNHDGLMSLQTHADKRGITHRLVDLTTGSETIARYWPLVSFLSRTLRLSDQRATAEGACYD